MSRRHERIFAFVFAGLFGLIAEWAGAPEPWPIVAAVAGLAIIIWIYRWLIR